GASVGRTAGPDAGGDQRATGGAGRGGGAARPVADAGGGGPGGAGRGTARRGRGGGGDRAGRAVGARRVDAARSRRRDDSAEPPRGRGQAGGRSGRGGGQRSEARTSMKCAGFCTVKSALTRRRPGWGASWAAGGREASSLTISNGASAVKSRRRVCPF